MPALPDSEPPPRRRRRLRRCLLAVGGPVVAYLLTIAIFGTTSTVRGPTEPRAPTSIFILREALHVGLVIPDAAAAPSSYIEYGFGDWQYFALANTEWYRLPPAVLWPTAGALARRRFRATTPAELRARAPHYVELDEVLVEAAAVTRLRDRLTAEFAAGEPELVKSWNHRMSFVPSPASYWFGNTCADVVANWLAELDCEVSFVALRASLRSS
ncbi:MAG: DUF2459 domain-containing protein [bacterium]|nr:DUF2459 domain-containing protein [bacterium]